MFIIAILEKLLEPILTALGIALAGIIGTLASTMLMKMKRKLHLEVEEKEQEQTEKAIKEAILHINQTFVDEIKKSGSDLTKESAREALVKTVQAAKKKLTKLSAIRNSCAASLLLDDEQLVSKIEATIPKVKTELNIKVPDLDTDKI